VVAQGHNANDPRALRRSRKSPGIDGEIKRS
jgi:hypothetical protein